MSKAAAMTRSAAAVSVGNQSSPAATHSTLAAKAKTKTQLHTKQFLPPLPALSNRPNGFWDIQPFEKKAEPDHDVVDQTNVLAPHPDLAPYWGNVGDELVVHLFDQTLANYVPIKLPGDVWFRDTQQICPYLINLINCLFK